MENITQVTAEQAPEELPSHPEQAPEDSEQAIEGSEQAPEELPAHSEQAPEDLEVGPDAPPSSPVDDEVDKNHEDFMKTIASILQGIPSNEVAESMICMGISVTRCMETILIENSALTVDEKATAMTRLHNDIDLNGFEGFRISTKTKDKFKYINVVVKESYENFHSDLNLLLDEVENHIELLLCLQKIIHYSLFTIFNEYTTYRLETGKRLMGVDNLEGIKKMLDIEVKNDFSISLKRAPKLKIFFVFN